MGPARSRLAFVLLLGCVACQRRHGEPAADLRVAGEAGRRVLVVGRSYQTTRDIRDLLATPAFRRRFWVIPTPDVNANLEGEAPDARRELAKLLRAGVLAEVEEDGWTLRASTKPLTNRVGSRTAVQPCELRAVEFHPEALAERVREAVLRLEEGDPCAAPGGATSTAADTAAVGWIVGTVRDSETGRPLPGAAAAVSARRVGGLADTLGRYGFALPAGRHVVTVRRLGYRARSDTVLVAAGRTTPLDIALDVWVVRLAGYGRRCDYRVLRVEVLPAAGSPPPRRLVLTLRGGDQVLDEAWIRGDSLPTASAPRHLIFDDCDLREPPTLTASVRGRLVWRSKVAGGDVRLELP